MEHRYDVWKVKEDEYGNIILPGPIDNDSYSYRQVHFRCKCTFLMHFEAKCRTGKKIKLQRKVSGALEVEVHYYKINNKKYL